MDDALIAAARDLGPSPGFSVVPGVHWNDDAVTQKFAWMGRSGSGKSYGCKRFIEQMLVKGVQVIVVDTVGVYFGLRQGPNAFSIPILGGLWGDMPLQSTGGELVAETAVETGSSMVIDTSQMRDPERAKFMEAFGRRLFELLKHAPRALHVVLDEAQDIIPQNPQPNENGMLHEWVRNSKQGRVVGMGISFSSQRPQELNKKALNQVECVMAFQLTGAHERKALDYWLSDKGIEEKLSSQLPTLQVGEPFVWSPQWLKVARICGRVLPILTQDTSQTPKIGVAATKREMRSIDIGSLAARMATLVEEVKQNDPQALREEIKRLQKLVTEGGTAPTIDTATAKALIARGHRYETRQASAIEAMLRRVDELKTDTAMLSDELRRQVAEFCAEHLASEWEEFFKDLGSVVATASKPKPLPEIIQPKPKETLATKAERVRASVRKTPDGSTGLPPGEEQCLRVISSRGEQGASTELLVLHTGYRAGSIRSYTHRLVTRGLARRQKNIFYATGAGDELCPAGQLPTGKKLLDHYEETLPPGEAFVIRRLRVAKAPLSVSDLATGGTYTEGSLRSYTHRLCTRGIIKRKNNRFSLVDDAK